MFLIAKSLDGLDEPIPIGEPDDDDFDDDEDDDDEDDEDYDDDDA
jgi:hypothetical protein